MGLRAVPRSLVATEGISVDFFSSGYLDISVPRVRLHTLWIQVWIPPESGGFPHSEIPGSGPVYRLPEAYRRLRRPSSPLAAKASTGCTFMLDHIIQRMLQLPCHGSANGQPKVGHRRRLLMGWAAWLDFGNAISCRRNAAHSPGCSTRRSKRGACALHQDASTLPPASRQAATRVVIALNNNAATCL